MSTTSFFRGLSRPRKALPWMLALLPALSFGFLAAVPSVYWR